MRTLLWQAKLPWDCSFYGMASIAFVAWKDDAWGEAS